LKKIARRVHLLTARWPRDSNNWASTLRKRNRRAVFRHAENQPWRQTRGNLKAAEARRMNFRHFDAQTIGISLDETTREKDVMDILAVFNGGKAPEIFHPRWLRKLRRNIQRRWRGPVRSSSTPSLTRIIPKRKCCVICGGWKAGICR
jgi:hypothetical protein